MGISDNNRIELKMTREIIRDFSIKIKNFLEIGSKDGDDSFYFKQDLNLDPKNIHIIEASPTFYDIIKNKYPDFNVHNLAAWKEDGFIEFNNAKDLDDGRSSILNRDIYKQDNFETVKVECNKISTFLNNNDIDSVDLVKIDVEGATLEVLYGFEHYLQSVRLLQVETEQFSIWENQYTKKDVFKFLQKNNFMLLWDLDLGKTQNDSIWMKK